MDQFVPTLPSDEAKKTKSKSLIQNRVDISITFEKYLLGFNLITNFSEICPHTLSLIN